MTERVKSPAFQYYPRDVLADAHVMAMTLEEFGAYWKLVSICWLQGTLPAELARLARLIQVSTQKMQRMWPAMAPLFETVGDQIRHPGLEAEREKQAEWRRKSSLGGKRSAEARDNQPPTRRRATTHHGPNHPSTNGEPHSEPPHEATANHAPKQDTNQATNQATNQPRTLQFASASATASEQLPEEESSSPEPRARPRGGPESPPARRPASPEVRKLARAVAARLLTDTDREALSAVLTIAPEPGGWAAEMLSSLDGMAGHTRVTPEQLGQALRDYAGNGVDRPSLAHFRGYLRRAAMPPRSTPPANGESEEQRQRRELAEWAKGDS